MDNLKYIKIERLLYGNSRIKELRIYLEEPHLQTSVRKRCWNTFYNYNIIKISRKSITHST